MMLMAGKRKPRGLQKYGHLWPKVLVDPCDLWLLTAYAWCIKMCGGKPYVAGTDHINGRAVMCFLHRVIMNAPPGVEVDHINGNTLDNRRCNLRICTHKENGRNQKSHGGSSKYKGVSWHKQRRKWQAQIKVDGKNIHLGYFDDEEGTAFTYDVAARILFGDFARLNFQE